ncbi:MAG TPA: SIMPL domain-containing protein [Ignavibacteria bacterium]|nr:SIMPL domain-containing protein [Ignavibacteria bacterium]
MENNSRYSIYIIISSVLALSFICAALVISTTWKKVARSNVTINVTGSASKQIKSDLGIWNGGFSNESPSMTDAYAKLKESNTKIKSYLVSFGFAEEKIKFSAINTTTLYEPVKGVNTGGYYDGGTTSSGKILGYRLSQNVSVESEDVDKIDKLSREVTELINQGISINSEPPRFLYTKLSDLKIEMIGLASQDAKVRAEQIAKATGDKVGEVRSSKTGVMQVNAKNSTEVSDYGINDTSSLEKTITAVVNVTFSIE